ncbi:hypothetical protein PQU92_02580 [Asticcacaulis sp. BYS171W]|uniref:Uncharacterized protein n=1 Tax=Asticcacaulis aquaticus TaxID=2984212 RepID=A0ABT5HPZ7_9CAUL|nr:hypothetical protein [Asticcacaulis aquaticus]MDC7682143.1 hypothetical protein [Asticcacaulis aquaticus]
MNWDMPDGARRYLKGIFEAANETVSSGYTKSPHQHETMLDNNLLNSVSDKHTRLFEGVPVNVTVKTHFIGSRRMMGNFEVADIAIDIGLARHGFGRLRKVALLQTKRLFPDLVSGQLQKPVTQGHKQLYRFDDSSLYQAFDTGGQQIATIDAYMQSKGIPVYYGFYNPLTLSSPMTTRPSPTHGFPSQNDFGMRIMRAQDVHGLARRVTTTHLSAKQLDTLPHKPRHGNATHSGWRLETFVADEVLLCHEGQQVTAQAHGTLLDLLDLRDRPLYGQIDIDVEVGFDH